MNSKRITRGYSSWRGPRCRPFPFQRGHRRMDFTPRRVVRVESSRSVWQSRMQSRLRRAETRVLRALLTSSAITTPRSTYGWFVRYESTHDGACEPAHDITRGPAHDIVARPPTIDRAPRPRDTTAAPSATSRVKCYVQVRVKVTQARELSQDTHAFSGSGTSSSLLLPLFGRRTTSPRSG